MKKIFVYLLLSSFVFILYNNKVYSKNSVSSMVKSMQIEDAADISISDESYSMTFLELAENYASVIMDKNASAKQLEALGNLIQIWMNALSENYTKDEMFNEYSKITSSLSCMSIHLILRIAIKDNNIPTESAQDSIYNTINNKFIPSFAEFKNDGWKTEFNFYVINMSAAVCKWYEDESKKLDYPNFKVWREGGF
ncbi:hypothetical protein [uncultured Brachyspira sp.]|uniref:hypothetical protein n=1 Tax=uncultured Brachyspira sp. TaxID=221953 RepID=UPI0025D6EB05|nr:hypothetical protein [uncultured Brachyspira sp.]